MTWIDQKHKLDTTGGRLKGTPELAAPRRRPEKVYSISEVATLMSVSKGTVNKWLSIDEPEYAVIPPDAWFRLPNGYVRIREWVVLKLQTGEL